MAGPGSPDAAGNGGGAGATPSITLDTLAPTLAITSDKSALKSGEPATISFTFTDTPSGFAAEDITVANGTLTNLTQSANPNVWTATRSAERRLG